jgi:hypothetical protein
LFFASRYMIWGALDGSLRVWNEETDQLHDERWVEADPGTTGRVWFLQCEHGKVAAVSWVGVNKGLFELWDVDEFEQGNLSESSDDTIRFVSDCPISFQFRPPRAKAEEPV